MFSVNIIALKGKAENKQNLCKFMDADSYCGYASITPIPAIKFFSAWSPFTGPSNYYVDGKDN